MDTARCYSVNLTWILVMMVSSGHILTWTYRVTCVRLAISCQDSFFFNMGSYESKTSEISDSVPTSNGQQNPTPKLPHPTTSSHDRLLLASTVTWPCGWLGAHCLVTLWRWWQMKRAVICGADPRYLAREAPVVFRAERACDAVQPVGQRPASDVGADRFCTAEIAGTGRIAAAGRG